MKMTECVHVCFVCIMHRKYSEYQVMRKCLSNLAWRFANRAVQPLPCGIPVLYGTVPGSCGLLPDSA